MNVFGNSVLASVATGFSVYPEVEAGNDGEQLLHHWAEETEQNDDVKSAKFHGRQGKGQAQPVSHSHSDGYSEPVDTLEP